MRIAEISTLARPVPPKGEGSVEYLVSRITEALADRGHEVTLFATADSRTKGKLRSPVETSYRVDPSKWDWHLYENFQAHDAFQSWKDFDIIHCHSYYYGLLYCDFVPIPTIHSFHLRLGPDYRFLAERTKNREMICCSRFQAQCLGEREDVHIIPHGIDTGAFYFSNEPEDYLVFLGRFIAGKGPEIAINVAKKSGKKLKLAAPANDYYRDHIEPHVDGEQIEYVGEVRGPQKARLLSKARALLYPVRDPEPFGLVLPEAMASGVPVIAFNRGAVPEVINHGESGLLVEDEEEMVQAINYVEKFDRQAIHRHATEHYSTSLMIDRFEDLMERLVKQSRR